MPGIGIGNAGSPAKILEDEDDDEGRGRLSGAPRAPLEHPEFPRPKLF
jgi:hypothetical protein